jgi:hypothetical protein
MASPVTVPIEVLSVARWDVGILQKYIDIRIHGSSSGYSFIDIAVEMNKPEQWYITTHVIRVGETIVARVVTRHFVLTLLPGLHAALL